MVNTHYQQDNIQRPILGVSSIPFGPDAATAVLTVAAGTMGTFIIRTIPDSDRLSLWNYLESIVVDSFALDSNGDFGYEYPVGTLLTNAQLKMSVSVWDSWALSSDLTNLRVKFITVQNNDTVSHTYYVLFKAYTFSSVPTE